MTQNGRIPAIEEWLESTGITGFDYRVNVRLEEIDRNAGKHNRARMQAIEEDRVVLLAEALESGDDLGPIILYKRPRKRLLDPLDGNHRLEALTLADQHSTAAYVITQELTETQEWVLIGTANGKHGQPSGLEDRVLWAVNTIEKFGMTQAEAARIAKIPSGHVSKRVQQIAGQRRFTQLVGERRAKKLHVTKLARLHSIRSDVVAKQAAEIVADAGLNQEDVSRMVVSINKARGEKEQLGILHGIREEVQKQRAVTVEGKVELPLPIRRAQRLAKTIENFDFDELREANMDSMLRKQIRLRLAESAARLAEEAKKF